MTEWNIQARAHACQECGRDFAEEEGMHTLLFDEREGYRRLDVCEACWSSRHEEGANHRKGFVSHWRTLHKAPEAAAPEAIQKETAETLLRKLVERHEPEHAGARFILAVMLERKRLLKVKARTVDEGRRVYLYEHSKSGDVFPIRDPELQLDQLEQVQKDVARLLERGPDTSAPATEIDPPVESSPAAIERSEEQEVAAANPGNEPALGS